MAAGEWDVDGMLARMPARLFAEWLAYYELEPWGEERDDYRAGLAPAAIENALKGKGRATQPMDYFKMYYDTPPAPKQSEPDMKAMFGAFCKSADKLHGNNRKT